MKKQYTTPEINVKSIELEDVITASRPIDQLPLGTYDIGGEEWAWQGDLME